MRCLYPTSACSTKSQCYPRYLPMQATMADDKSKRGSQDRRTVAAGQGYELREFASKHGITEDQARDLIHKHGNDRKKLTKPQPN